MNYETNKYGISRGLFDLLVRMAEETGDKTLMPYCNPNKTQEEIEAINMAKARRVLPKRYEGK